MCNVGSSDAISRESDYCRIFFLSLNLFIIYFTAVIFFPPVAFEGFCFGRQFLILPRPCDTFVNNSTVIESSPIDPQSAFRAGDDIIDIGTDRLRPNNDMFLNNLRTWRLIFNRPIRGLDKFAKTNFRNKQRRPNIFFVLLQRLDHIDSLVHYSIEFIFTIIFSARHSRNTIFSFDVLKVVHNIINNNISVSQMLLHTMRELLNDIICLILQRC